MSFHENISRAAQTYEQLARAGTDFNSQYRINPQTGAVTRVGLWSRIRGETQTDQRARLEVIEKIMADVATPMEIDPQDRSACIAMIQRCTEQLREVQLARALFKGIKWDRTQSKELRDTSTALDAKAYHIQARIRKLRNCLSQISGAYFTKAVEEGWLQVNHVNLDWQPRGIPERDFGDRSFQIFIRGTEAFIYMKPVGNYLLDRPSGGGVTEDAMPVHVDLASESLENVLRGEIVRNNSQIMLYGLVHGDLRAVSALVTPNPSHDYRSALRQLVESKEELKTAKPTFKAVSPPSVLLSFILEAQRFRLCLRYIDPETLTEKVHPFELASSDGPVESQLKKFCSHYVERIEQMPDSLQGTARLNDEPIVDRYGDLRRYVDGPDEIRGTGAIGIRHVGDKVEVYEPLSDGEVKTHVVSNNRLSIAFAINEIQTRLHRVYAKEQFDLFCSQIDSVSLRRFYYFSSDENIRNYPVLLWTNDSPIAFFRDYGAPFRTPIDDIRKVITPFKNAKEQEEAYAYLARWNEALQVYEEGARALVEGGPVSYFDDEITMTYIWHANSRLLFEEVKIDGETRLKPLYTVSDTTAEARQRMATLYHIERAFRIIAENDPKVKLGKGHIRLGEVYLDMQLSGIYIARHMTAKGQIVETEIDATETGALDILESLRDAARNELAEFWTAVNVLGPFGQTTVSVFPNDAGEAVANITTPDVRSDEVPVDSLKSIQAAVERHQMVDRMQKLIGETVVVEIHSAPEEVPIQRLREMASSTEFAPQINTLIGWIESRSPYLGVPGDPVEREQWYTKLETLIRLSVKHFMDHPDPGAQITYLAGMADSTAACGGAWMDQAYIQYVSLMAPDQFRRIQQPGPRLGTLLSDTKTAVINRLIDKYLILAQQQDQQSDPRHMRLYLLQRIGRDVGLPVLDASDTHAPGFMEEVDVMEDFREELLKFSVDELIDNVHRSMLESMDKGEVSRLFGAAIVQFIEDKIQAGHPEQILIGGEPAISQEDFAKMREAMDSMAFDDALNAYDPMMWGPAHFWKDGVITRDAVELLLAQFGFIPPSHERPHLLT